eukprot:CAMPEP_0172444148 /NCGR_PEP_ID=MMETSP1065-20121228/4236_1 /TAXON_ID=265537 /ORGANISM="Amphiprora paludosa, Strain CCMP125" /LENGTH=262 /DNA_ID=CAMNT_0013194571 /DNA_START=181 /DNA_END=969 /DNA_ORIENTATION=+
MTGETTDNDEKATTETLGEKVHLSGHPVLAHKITILRSSQTRSGTFRAVLREVTYHLAYEATSRLSTRPIEVTVPVPPLKKDVNGEHTSAAATTIHYSHGQKLKESVALIPILRSGLGMADAMLELVPNAAVHHIGMYKVLGQNPVQYFNRLPRQCTADVAYVLDPVIQTSSTVMSVLSILKKWGVSQINLVTVLASRQGLQQIIEAHPDVTITVGTIDEELREDGVVLPGMGDAGDRLFATDELEDDEALLHPSKRKRTMD